MIWSSNACSASSVGAGTSTKTGSPSVRRYTPSSTRQCKWMFRLAARAEALDQRDRAAVGLLGLQPGLLEQEASDCSVHDLQHRRHQQRLRGQQQAQRDRQRQHPLAHRHMRDDVFDQVRGGLRHAPRAARGAEPPALAAEGDELVVAAVGAAQAQETVRQDAADQLIVLVLEIFPRGGAYRDL